MASLVLCNRRGGKCTRLNIDGVNLSGNVSDFRRAVAEKIEAPSHEIELLYCGHRLEDERTLESYGARPGVTIHALRRHDTDMQQDAPEKMDAGVVQQVVTALQSALMNPAYRSTVERILTDPETLENIIAATPGLDRDPVGISILQDPELLALLADPNNIQKVIDEHPCLGQAAMMVAAAVNEEGAKSGGGSNGASRSRSARGTYSLDQMSDDEDMEGPGPRSQLGGAASITSSQLAAALAAAAGGSGGASGSGMASATPAQVPPGSSAPSTSAAAASMITADFFRQAIQAAAISASPTAATNAPQPTTPATPTQEQPPHIRQAQLEQLRDMGISDENAARQALQVTNGNLEAAIALLFGDGGF